MKKIFLAAVSGLVLAGAALAGGGVVYADGNGSPAACLGGPSVSADPVASYDAGSGNVVTGVCIKSGSNMFGGNQHSGVLGNGTYESGCYQVEGVGTQEVTVSRLLSGPGCQGISHIDAIVGTAPEGEDICPNIEGDQSTVPDGLIIDGEGNCVEPPVLDVCPNIEGIQTQIPDGMVKDEQDNCVVPEEPDEDGGQVLSSTTTPPQVQATPTGAVSAGAGGGTSGTVAGFGLLSSIATLGLGLRLKKWTN